MRRTKFINSKNHSKNPYNYKQINELGIDAELNPIADKNFVQLFQEQASKTPKDVAIIIDKQEFSYKQMNEKSNQLARKIRKFYRNFLGKELTANTLISLCFERGIDMIIAMLAISKAGAAYVPIDPHYPKERIAFMFNDTQCQLVLTSSNFSSHLQSVASSTAQDISFLEVDANNYESEATENLDIHNDRNDLIYVIYTSGTTGNPKGVMITHAAFSHFLLRFKNKFIHDRACVLSLTYYTFDIFGLEYGLPLISGKPLILSDIMRFKKDFIHYQNKINVIQQTPSVLSAICEELPAPIVPYNMVCLVGGEAVSSSLIQKLKKLFSHVINVYGPTETTIWSAAYPSHDGQNYIGTALDDEQIYILDASLKPVASGEVGELYIGGAGLAKGYLNLPLLTKERFINNPFATELDKERGFTKLYKSGDLALRLPNNLIKFMGRNDFQVKIRGHRIELGEIENSIMLVPGIKHCVVISHLKEPSNENSQTLVAYYVSDNEIPNETILNVIAAHLPDYMLPSAFVHLKQFPLTANGKLDRKALPEPKFNTGSNYVAPITALETKLCEIWGKLLKISEVGVADDFFYLGGNSILAIRCVQHMNEQLNLHYAVADIFAHKTIANLIAYAGTNDTLEIIKQDAPKAILSYAQERLWFLEQYENGNQAYHLPMLFKSIDNINLQALNDALQAVIDRHEILRTNFIQDGSGKDFQVSTLKKIKINTYSFDSKEDYETQLANDIQTSFDLRNDLPIRAIYYHLKAGNEFYLLINIHHIAFDGWSSDVFIKELSAFYKWFAENIPHGVKPLEIQYKDFAIWQRKYLSDDVITSQLNYWRKKLDGYEALQLPIDKTRPLKFDYQGKNIAFKLSSSLSHQLRALAKENGCTLYATLLTGFYVLLHHYTGQNDILIGTPVANRHHPKIQDLVGFFVNSIALRAEFNPATDSFHTLLQKTKSDLIDLQRYQDIPFEMIVHHFGGTRDASRHPIFNVMFGVQNFENWLNPNDNDLLKPVNLDPFHAPAKFDLSLIVNDGEEILSGTLNYAASLFESETIKRMIVHYKKVLESLVENDKQLICDTSLLTSDEYTKIIYDWNKTDVAYPNEHTITQKITEQVAKFPHRIAISLDDEHLTYAELNDRSDLLARQLKNQYQTLTQKKINSGTLIGISLPRSLDMIVAILAVLKTGGAYVPMDPNSPPDRIKFITQDAKLSLVMTNKQLREQFNAFRNDHCTIITLEDLQNINVPVENVESTIHPTDLAYVIYTSGTTGNPKGVMINHRSVINMVSAQHHAFQVSATSRILQFASIVFDASVWEIFNALTCGARLVIVNEVLRHDVHQLIQHLKKEKVTIATLPPALLSQASYSDLPDLKYLIVAGEACDPKTVAIWSKGRNFINAYGPTETTVCATLHHYALGDRASIIGKPLQNIRAYVLNPYKQAVPIGVIGELYVGGACLAQGYLNREDLTQARFIDHPFMSESDKEKGYTKLYKTGDLVRYLADGDIEYIGRNDTQVKIRGYRIELSEIENHLLQHENISKSVVLVMNREINHSNIQDLIAYYVADSAIDENRLRAHLAHKLPDYMIPNAFVHLLELPLTLNGKIDVKRLPKPNFANDRCDYAAPRNEIESALCLLWQEFLSLEKISIHDDFFKLGGNSILAIQLVARITHELKMKISVADIFTYKTVAELATQLRDDKESLIIAENNADAPLSLAQESLWFIEKYEEGSNLYHIPLIFDLSAHANKMHLSAALQAVVHRHQILRSVFRQNDDGEAYQTILDQPLTIDSFEFLSKKEFEQQIDLDINRPFDLENALPIRAAYYTIPSNDGLHETKLLINLHHIVFDGWSVVIFLNEVDHFYNHYHHGSALSLSPLPIQYKDYATWQRKLAKSESSAEHLAFWKNNLQELTAINFPLSKPRPQKQNYEGDSIHFNFDEKLSKAIRHAAQVNGYSLFTVLLTGFYILLHKYTNQTDLVVGTPSANRNHPHIQNLIGYFINSLVLRVQFAPNLSIKSLLEIVNTTLVNAQRHQDISFDQLVKHLNIKRDESMHPLFQIMFSMQSSGIKKHNEISSWRASDKKTVLDNKTAKFDLLLVIEDETEADLVGYFNYASSLFDHEIIENLSIHFKNIVQTIVDNISCPINELNYLSAKECETFLYDWNKTDVAFDKHKTLAQKFEDQVLKTPDNIALECEGETITYADLNAKANQLARFLKQQYFAITNEQLPSDTLMALYFERSVQMVISILAVLKAGAAYVPLSPEHPISHVQNLLKDCGAKIMLTHSMVNYDALKEKALCINVDDNQFIHFDASNLCSDSSPQSLACVLYTSGTTGLPKGVLIEQRSIVNHIEWLQSKIHLTEKDAIIQKASYIYDASVREILWANWYGAKTVLAKPQGHKDSLYLYHLIQTHSVKMVHFIPTMLDAFLMHIESAEKRLPASLRFILCGGEMLKETLVDKAYQLAQHKDFVLYNVYGPTETTINVTHCHRTYQSAGNIGRPNHNTHAYILDNNLKPVPCGVVGELYIAGVGLARGYLNRDDLTQERFIKNPFIDRADKNENYTRLYKTGDLARFLPNGDIECMGRNDFQVKIRGYRIELNEIENVLSQVPGIENCVVLVHSRAQQVREQHLLVAYYSAKEIFATDRLVSALSLQLPEHMIPTIFIRIETWPLTVSGKLDRKSLPKPDLNLMMKTYVAPRNEEESQLCSIWQDLLGLERVGIDDDFFALGGNSILSIQLLARIIKVFKISIRLKDIFENRTIKNIAKVIQEPNAISSAFAEPIAVKKNDPVISYQQSLIFDYLNIHPTSRLFQSGVALAINEKIDVDAFKASIKSTLEEYPLFRTQFHIKNNHYSPVLFDIDSINLDSLFSYEFCDFINQAELEAYAENCRLELAQQVFDYRKEFLYKLKLIIAPNNQSILICCMSRLLADGYSLAMFIKSLFKNLRKSNSEILRHLPKFDYFDYAEWQRNAYNSEKLKNSMAYWLAQDVLKPERNILKIDKTRSRNLDGLCECEKIHLDLETTANIRAYASSNHVSVYSIFFGAWAMYLAAQSRVKDLNITCIHRNRNKIEFEHIQGPFSDYLPIRVKDFDCYAGDTINYFKYIDNLIRDGLDHALPYSLLLKELKVSDEEKLKYHYFPFSQTAVNFPSPYIKQAKQQDDLPPFRFIENTKHTTSFEISVVISEDAHRYSISMNYRNELFYKNTILKFLNEYVSLITTTAK